MRVFDENNREIQLTKNEYDILIKIWQAQGRLVTREALMKEVIGYDNYMYDRTIDTHIKNVRKKLSQKDMILTLRGK
jgi:DNA-binding response OmpR family regulator